MVHGVPEISIKKKIKKAKKSKTSHKKRPSRRPPAAQIPKV